MPESENIEAVSLNFPWMKEEAPLILVVEDDLSTSELLTLHLSQAGYKVAHAFNGEEAMEKARKLQPFAITLDVLLPKKDGWEVLQELKGDQTTSHIPVIIHSWITKTLQPSGQLITSSNLSTRRPYSQNWKVTQRKRALLSLSCHESEDETNSLKEIFGRRFSHLYHPPARGWNLHLH
jgi:hypothetical protein